MASAILTCTWWLGWSTPCAAQEGGEVTVRVRPERVRVGATFIVTVRVVGPERPDVVELAVEEWAELVDVRERTSWAVGPKGGQAVTETDFVLRALACGHAAPAEAWAVVSGDTVRVAVPRVEAMAAPMAVQSAAPTRARERGGAQRIRDDGEPPEGTGRTGTQPTPWGGYPYGPGLAGMPTSSMPGTSGTAPYPHPYGSPAWPGANPYGPTGWGTAPPGRGWASTADGDPAWYDLVPRLERYEATARDARGLVTLEAGITPGRVYEGQQATLVATASFAPEALARLGSGPELFPPAVPDAWTVEIPYAPPSPAAVGGRLQEAHTLMRAFFPLTPGKLHVDGVRLRYGTGSGGAAHAPGEELVTDPLGVEVLAVPRTEAPPGWGGAVGRFRVSAWVEPAVVGWGEAAFLTVEVAGAGNVQTLPRPDPGPVWGAELRPVGERAMVEVRDGVVGGVKTFTWLVVPPEAAPVRIGPIIYAFFDPWMEGFGQVASGEVVLDARPVASAWHPSQGGVGDDVPTWVPPWDRYDARPDGGTDVPPWPAARGAPEGSRDPPQDTFDAGQSITGALPAAWTVGVRRATNGPEARGHATLEALALRPGEPALWLDLAEAYGEGRSGDGWREWAALNGLLRAPRDRELREALWGDGGWRGRRAGLPALPLTSEESGTAAGALGALGIVALAWGRHRRGRETRRFPPPLAVLLVAGAAVVSEPWARHRLGDRPGVVVEGPARLHAAPCFSSEEDVVLPAGTAVSLGERFGDWVEVVDAWGRQGWVEGVRALPLEPGRGR
jgi:hypothetical protein